MPEYLVTLVKLNKEQDEHRENSFRQTDPEQQKFTSKIREAYKTKAKSKKNLIGKKNNSCSGPIVSEWYNSRS